jgi:arylsulfatase A-like enzyme
MSADMHTSSRLARWGRDVRASARTAVGFALLALAALAGASCGGDEASSPNGDPSGKPTDAARETPDTDRSPGSEAPVAKNLLLISIDTLRPDVLGVYGGKRGATPRIDTLARRAIVFDNAWTHTPKTAPAHMSMFTGLPPSVHGVGNLNTSGAQRLPASIRTLSEVLQDAGFATGGFTGGGNVKGSLGFDRGFDVFDDENDAFGAKLERVRPWIEKADASGQPWYCFVHTYHTHDPYFPEPAWMKRFVKPGYDGKILSTRAAIQAAIEAGDDLAPTMKGHEKITWNYWYRVNEKSPKDLAHLFDLYTAGVAHMDKLVGDFLERLERKGLLDDTIIVFTSDHGEEFGEHGEVRHDQLWVECAHVPMLLCLPGALHGGTRIPEVVRHIDLTPSLLDLLDVRDHGLEPIGVSWADWLAPGSDRGAPRSVIGEHQSRRENPLDVFSLREEHLLLMDRAGTVELFDRRQDRLEKAAVARPKVQERLETTLAEHRATFAALAAKVGRGEAIEIDDALRAELEALGYLGAGDDK